MFPLNSTRLAGALFLAMILTTAPRAVLAQSGGEASNVSAVADSGVFSILSSQRRIGTEKFKIAPVASGWEDSAEIDVTAPGSPHITETSTMKLDANLRPVSYERQQKLPKKGSIAVGFGSPETKLVAQTEAGAENQIFLLPQDHLVVLDTNLFHHYSFLVRLYDGAKGGPQHFNVFVPQEATPGTIGLELKGKESVTVGKTARELNHFEAVTDEVKIDLWASPEGAIYRMAIPQANLEVVRQ